MFEGFMERMARIDSAIDILRYRHPCYELSSMSAEYVFSKISAMFGINELTSDEQEYIKMRFSKEGVDISKW